MVDPSQGDALPTIQLKAEGQPSVTVRLQVNIDGDPLRLAITVPSEPVALRSMLPVLQGFTNAVVALAEEKVQEAGESISCKAGCGACCRQIVPISPSEAHAIRQLVESFAETKQQVVRLRFADAISRLKAAGLLEPLLNPEEQLDEGQMAEDYFRLGIACPFLENESCSIHQDRPLACREYLVTSPAEECSRPGDHNVRCVYVAPKCSWALRAMDWDAQPTKSGWLPLVLALEWAAVYPEPEACSGPQWVQHFFKRLNQAT